MSKQKLNVSEIEVGDVFSEQSHYIFKGCSSSGMQFTHLESGKDVTLGESYVTSLLQTADQYNTEVKIGKEDKLWTAKQLKDANNTTNREGDVRLKGIRSIWNDINSEQVFQVSYNKANKELSKTAITKARDAQIANAIIELEKAQKSKTGILNAAKKVMKEMQENPVSTIEKGEERILRGYKVQFESSTGFFDVVDMDIKTGMNMRKVNLNEINWIIIGGVKYTVE